ncbi:hypothetical protein KG091_00840 [Carnobacteriaceae bacterium zg-ZUI78]|uniref:hypothetical protein n=1 Tax=Granulicatella sp. zg-84 TaxID=2678503 RepID=UPI0013C16AD0|nr:hypothetical protein [Granulicatella sp. zg-84]MBS4749614.1 hypothetical protein [Carnobacteriaceae bacterium zg-ZUI78]NEW66341.1 hypothetical protein [Granulicatella sp. zg-84]QMI86483.1 hypothetical protein H1220_03820 [Carnobacteriaceae bacterium zg-84]
MRAKQILVSIILFFGLMYTVSGSVDAARGNVLLYHGEEDKQAMAKMTSTQTEARMEIRLYVTYDDNSNVERTGVRNNTTELKVLSGFAWWKGGTSTASYYVDFVHVGDTLAPYRF